MKILTDDEIKNRLKIALDKLYVKDCYLLKHSAHERSITHKLAEYLQELFPDYDVDCEYNVDIDNDNDRKMWLSDAARIKLKELLEKIKIELNPENYDLSQEIGKLSKNFYPDIIIHKRGTNKHNLLVIEAKKEGNDTSFDEEKLKAFTELDGVHHYKFNLGALVTIDIGDHFIGNDFTEPVYYQNGLAI
jgi:hypothetical protein